MDEVLLSIKDLRVSFKTNSGLVKAVRGVSFDLYKNEVLAVVGESGSGKSVTSKAIMGVLESNSIVEQGQIIFEDKDLLRIKESTYNKVRGSDIGIIYQDTMSTLNPIMRVGKQVLESLLLKEKKAKKEARLFIKTFSYLSKAKLDELYVKEVSSYYLNNNEELLKFNNYLQSNKNKLNALSETISQYSKCFEDTDNFNFSTAFNEFKKICKEYSNFTPIVKNVLDYSISSSISLIKSLFISMKNSFKDIDKREKVFKKNPEAKNDYYLLPKKIKANLKEEIIEPFYFYTRIKEELNSLLKTISQKEIKNYDDENYKKLLEIVKEKISILYRKVNKADLKKEVISLLKEVGIKNPDVVYEQYPFELSGGMRQRIAIIIAICMEPKVLICDEPTTSLDVTIQKQILNLIKKIKEKNHLSVIFITHDLSVVSMLADRVVIMYAGKVLEKGTVYDIFYDPRHPYTWSLLSAIPENKVDEDFTSIKGNVPNMVVPLKGDAFAYRSDYAVKQDTVSFPEEYVISSSHFVYSHLYHEFANKVSPPDMVVERIRKSLKENPINIPFYTNKKNSVLEILKKEGSI
ncbi:MAG: ABC transporter ATP-binding protein [Bacilli bacterium]|nr:ABC transporter ATP-binding protein [Bacilli bacterium]